MAILKLLDRHEVIEDQKLIKKFLNERGILIEQWASNRPLNDSDSQETILAAYEHELRPFMQKNGYQSADVINVHKETPNIEELRAKFLAEHTHSEDEIRFFVEGEGEFFFHLQKPTDEVFSLVCRAGDFISVPQGYTHWFDLAPNYRVKAIRIFQTKEGWVANYTHTGVEKKYQ